MKTQLNSGHQYLTFISVSAFLLHAKLILFSDSLTEITVNRNLFGGETKAESFLFIY